jgi:4-amino-4-deoxy-L-arabinose transferase-like glycosyltransferase
MELSLIILGVVASAVVEYIKVRWDTPDSYTLAVVALLALAFSTLVWAASHYGFIEALTQILATAGATYAFLMRTLEKNTNVIERTVSYLGK